MNIDEKNIVLKYNESSMTLSLNTFLSIIFECMKNEIIDYDDINYLNSNLKMIKNVLDLTNNDNNFIEIDFNLKENEELFMAFSFGLSYRADFLCYYSVN